MIKTRWWEDQRTTTIKLTTEVQWFYRSLKPTCCYPSRFEAAEKAVESEHDRFLVSSTTQPCVPRLHKGTLECTHSMAIQLLYTSTTIHFHLFRVAVWWRRQTASLKNKRHRVSVSMATSPCEQSMRPQPSGFLTTMALIWNQEPIQTTKDAQWNHFLLGNCLPTQVTSTD